MSRVIKAYKILKRYPSLNEKFQVGDYLIKTNTAIFANVPMYTPLDEKNSIFLGVKEVEEYPEFFEKVTLQIIVKEIKDDK